jgi:hypothetical protein
MFVEPVAMSVTLYAVDQRRARIEGVVIEWIRAGTDDSAGTPASDGCMQKLGGAR